MQQFGKIKQYDSTTSSAPAMSVDRTGERLKGSFWPYLATKAKALKIS